MYYVLPFVVSTGFDVSVGREENDYVIPSKMLVLRGISLGGSML